MNDETSYKEWIRLWDETEDGGRNVATPESSVDVVRFLGEGGEADRKILSEAAEFIDTSLRDPSNKHQPWFFAPHDPTAMSTAEHNFAQFILDCFADTGVIVSQHRGYWAYALCTMLSYHMLHAAENMVIKLAEKLSPETVWTSWPLWSAFDADLHTTVEEAQLILRAYHELPTIILQGHHAMVVDTDGLIKVLFNGLFSHHREENHNE